MLKDGNVEIASLAELSRLVSIAKGKTFDEYIYETSPKGNTIVYDKDGKQVMIIGPLSDELKDALRDDNLWMWPSTEDATPETKSYPKYQEIDFTTFTVTPTDFDQFEKELGEALKNGKLKDQFSSLNIVGEDLRLQPDKHNSWWLSYPNSGARPTVSQITEGMKKYTKPAVNEILKNAGLKSFTLDMDWISTDALVETKSGETKVQDMALGFTPEVSYTTPSGIKFWISEDGEQAGYLPPGGDQWRKIKPLKTNKGQGGNKFYYRLEAKVNIPTTKIGDAETPKEGFRCVICGDWTLGWGEHKQFGNNPYPLSESGECCDECNQTRVIPARIRMARIKHKDASPEEDIRYVVIRKGGSLGSQKGFVPELQGVVVAEFDTAEEAKAEAKQYRSQLTPGEKGYYKISYVTRSIRADKLARLKAKDEAVRNVVYTHILVPYLYGDVNGNKPKSIPMGTEWAVHHLDADASNNSKDNLLLMSKEDHDRLEAIATKVDNKTATPEEIEELKAIAAKYKVEAQV